MSEAHAPLPRRDALLAARATRSLVAAEPRAASTEDLVIHADAVGAANLMRELVAFGVFDAALEEQDGRWQVVVRAESLGHAAALPQLVQLVAQAIDEGRLAFAALRVGQRTYTMHPLPAFSRATEPNETTAAAA